MTGTSLPCPKHAADWLPYWRRHEARRSVRIFLFSTRMGHKGIAQETYLLRSPLTRFGCESMCHTLFHLLSAHHDYIHPMRTIGTRTLCIGTSLHACCSLCRSKPSSDFVLIICASLGQCSGYQETKSIRLISGGSA